MAMRPEYGQTYVARMHGCVEFAAQYLSEAGHFQTTSVLTPARWFGVNTTAVRCNGMGCLSTCLCVIVAFAHCLAQTPVSRDNSKLPDAPSASKPNEQAEPALSPETSRESRLKVLYRKSRVFPDLATNTEPLIPAEEFKLFVSNSVSAFVCIENRVCFLIWRPTQSH